MSGNVPASRPRRPERRPVKPVTTNSGAAKPPAGTPPPVRTTKRTPPTEKKADPLEKIHLVILFKDAKVVEFAMSEVLRFSVDQGILTVILKNGDIERYSIFSVAKVTIE